jgi:hypothetical protein
LALGRLRRGGADILLGGGQVLAVGRRLVAGHAERVALRLDRAEHLDERDVGLLGCVAGRLHRDREALLLGDVLEVDAEVLRELRHRRRRPLDGDDRGADVGRDLSRLDARRRHRAVGRAELLDRDAGRGRQRADLGEARREVGGGRLAGRDGAGEDVGDVGRLVGPDAVGVDRCRQEVDRLAGRRQTADRQRVRRSQYLHRLGARLDAGRHEVVVARRQLVEALARITGHLAEAVADALEVGLADMGDGVDRVELRLEVAGRADRALEGEADGADRTADADRDGSRRLGDAGMGALERARRLAH